MVRAALRVIESAVDLYRTMGSKIGTVEKEEARQGLSDMKGQSDAWFKEAARLFHI